jgi:hypothetical protein
MVVVVELLLSTVTLVGLAYKPKLAEGVGVFTVREIVVVSFKAPEVPVIVIVFVPVVAVELTANVKREDDGVDEELKEAVTPDGNPLAARPTTPLNPATGLIVMVEVDVPP